MPKKEEQHKGSGHRKRLRERFLQGGLESFLDYEIIELLLTLGTPRKDCKQAAKDAIKEFGGLRGALDATLEELKNIKGIGSSNMFGIKLFQAMSERYAKEKIPKKIPLNSSAAVAKFLQRSIGREKKEHFVMLSLDARNNLIKKSGISIGTLNASIVHPREVFKEAIQCSAASIIIAHNHPSGDVNPSDEDIEMTKRLKEVGKILGIEILDHVIVARNDHYSLMEKKLVKK
jgi:DNA repair protein RadC